jgi:hypothetical protein
VAAVPRWEPETVSRKGLHVAKSLEASPATYVAQKEHMKRSDMSGYIYRMLKKKAFDIHTQAYREL